MRSAQSPPRRPDLDADVLIAEFNVLANEIAGRSQAQHFVLNVSIVAGGGIAAFVLAQPGRQVLALVLAYVCSFLGAIWLDHARVITSKGIYIGSNIWPQLRIIVGRDDLTTHEDWARTQDRNRLSWLAFVGPLMGVFVLPAILGAAYSLPSINGVGLWLAWSIGAGLTLLSIVYWVGYYLNHTLLTYVGIPYDVRRSIQQPVLDGSASSAVRRGKAVDSSESSDPGGATGSYE